LPAYETGTMTEESEKTVLQAIHAGKVSVTSSPDEKTREEQEELEAEHKKLELVGKRQDIEARKSYANKVFKLVCGWLSAMILLVTLSGFGSRSGWFQLSDSTLIALITTTTISVLGLFTIVANYLFKVR
jgi:hypothetical protein